MEAYLKKGVKEVIAAYPDVGEILTNYGIGCVQCAVGTCLLGDIVSIHGLAPEDEARMMAEIAAVVGSDGRVEGAASPQPRRPSAREVSYSPPVRKLVDEHKLIKRLLAVIPRLIAEARLTRAVEADLFRGVLDFIRGYADRFHHMKEEDILFDYTDRGAEIIQVMLHDHDRARQHVRAAAAAIEQGDVEGVAENLLAYRELLTEHIAKEDDILYPYIDRGLTTHQVGEIAQRSAEAESRVSADVPARYQRFIEQLEERFPAKEAEPCLN